MYRIAHISDLHLSAGNKEQEKSFRNLLNVINDKKCDHIIATGDIVHQPEKENFEFVRQILYDNNFSARDKLTIIPGNHEIFGGAEKNGKSFTFPFRCKNTDYGKNLKIFINSFKETFPSNFDGKYPFLKNLNGNIVLVGFNSVMEWNRFENPIGSNGYIDSFQTDRYKRQKRSLNKFKFKIALIHHHFYLVPEHGEDEVHTEWLYSERLTMQQYKSEMLASALKDSGVNITCHGHTHYTGTYRKYDMTFINSSGCFMPFTGDREKSFYIIEIPSGNTGRCKFKKIKFKG